MREAKEPMSKTPLPKIQIDGDVASIRVFSPTYGEHVITFDAVDAPIVALHRWYLHKNLDSQTFYARTRIGSRKVEMQRLLMGFPSCEVDHADRNGLNNRRSTNLRLATSSQNKANRGLTKSNKSGFKGVFWDKNRGKWRAEIRYQRVKHYLGQFESPTEAAEAYRAAAQRLFGEFASVN